MTTAALQKGLVYNVQGVQPLATQISTKRSPLVLLPLAMATGLAGFAWMGGGIPILADAAMILLTATCLVMLLRELLCFTGRFGIGAIVLYGGALVWFCADYHSNWLGNVSSSTPNFINFGPTELDLPAWVISKAAFVVCLFLAFAALGLLMPLGTWPGRIIRLIPEPGRPALFFSGVIMAFIIGLLPFFLFAAEPFHRAIWLELTSFRAGGATWLFGRTGNLNYNWEGYWTWMTKIGQLGGTLAAMYAIMIGRNPLTRLIALGIWLFWLALGFGSGSRSEVVYVGLPVIALLFIKYQTQAAYWFGKVSVRSYVICAALSVGALFLIQIQGHFRDRTIDQVSLSDSNITEMRGNEMFSTALLLYKVVPSEYPFQESSTFGRRYWIPIPRLILRFVIHPIPRALWKGKPGVSEFSMWYNQMGTGGDAVTGRGGGTVVHSIAGGPYGAFGLPGVIQYGLVFGLLCGVADRLLRSAAGRWLGLLVALGFATYLFRCFRDLAPANFYQLVIPTIVISILIVFANHLSGQRGDRPS